MPRRTGPRARSWAAARAPAALTFAAAIAVTSHAQAAVHCSAGTRLGATTCSIDPAFDSKALCNDGTLPAFWWRPGYGAGLSTWVIWLQGGKECIDPYSCAQRAADPATAPLLTSNGFRATPLEAAGILSPAVQENPSLYNANEILVHYCSSDDWSGDAAASGAFNAGNPATWNFKGRPIALAAIQSIAELAPAFAAASRIIVGGSSAGGQGATITLNDLLPLLPAGAQTLLVNDAGLTLDIGQYDTAQPLPYVFPGHPNAFETASMDGLDLWHGRGDAVCDSVARTRQQHFNCFLSSYVLQNGYIRQPAFVAISQLDTGQLPTDLCPQRYGMCNVPHSPLSKEGQYVLNFGVQMAANVVGAGTLAAYSAFSPDVYMHIMMQNNLLFPAGVLVGTAKVSPRDALATWLTNPTGQRLLTIGTGPGIK